MARLVDEPTSVHLPPSTAANASGIRNFDTGSFKRRAMAKTAGINTAVVTTLLRKDASAAATSISTARKIVLLEPETRWMCRPMASTTPVLNSAAEMTKKPAMVITAGSLNPDSPSLTSSTRVSVSPSSINTATRSIGSASVTNKMIAMMRTARTIAIATRSVNLSCWFQTNCGCSGGAMRPGLQVINRADKVVELDGLAQKAIGAQSDRRLRRVVFVAGDDEDRHIGERPIVTNHLDDRLAVNARQIQIEDDDVRLRLVRLPQTAFAIARRLRFVGLGR